MISVQICSISLNVHTVALPDHSIGPDTDILTSQDRPARQNSNTVALICQVPLQYSIAPSITFKVRSEVVGAHAVTLRFRSGVCVVHDITLQVRSTGSDAQVFTPRYRYMVSDAFFNALQDRPSGTDAHFTVPRSDVGVSDPYRCPKRSP